MDEQVKRRQVVEYAARYSRGAKEAGAWQNGDRPPLTSREVRAWWDARERLVLRAKEVGAYHAAKEVGLTFRAVREAVRRWDERVARWGPRFWELT